MQRITIGRYQQSMRDDPWLQYVGRTHEQWFGGWVEGVRDDGAGWIMWLDDNGSPCLYWAQREEDGGVIGEPVDMSNQGA